MSLNGILLVNKPAGFTSFDVIAKLRGVLSTRKIGHSGTLDPMATGVLTLFIGKATKVVDLIPQYQKRYVGRIKLGVETDTLDTTGIILKEEKTAFKEGDVCDVLARFRGEIQQIPPMYSAIKINGQKLYQLARKGKEVLRAPRNISIYSMDLTDFDDENQSFQLDISCSKGTYIRSLASDIGKKLNSYGCLSELVRLNSDGFSINECHTLEEIIEYTKSNKIQDKLLSVESLFAEAEGITLSLEDTKKFINGVKLKGGQFRLQQGEIAKIYDYNNCFIALASIDNCDFLRVKCFFVNRGEYEERL